MTDLKPCPVCHELGTTQWHGPHGWNIQCRHCQYTVSGNKPEHDWNERDPEREIARLTAKIKELEAALLYAAAPGGTAN